MKKNIKVIAIILILLSGTFTITSIEAKIADTAEKTYGSDIIDMIQAVNEDTLYSYLWTIQRFGPHPTGSYACDEVKEFIYDELSNTGLKVKLHTWNTRKLSGVNIEATHPGAGSENGIVIVCAHYDSVEISPGVDDDGSGVATVLSAAKIMSEYEFNCTVKFVFFSGEEQGLYGSQAYAKKVYEQNENLIGLINLDGVGYAKTRSDGFFIRELADDDSSWIVDVSKKISQTYFNQIQLNIVHLPDEPISDHASFRKYGYHTCYFFENTTNPFYHTSDDTLANVNISYLTKVCKLTIGSLAKMAEVNRKLTPKDIEITAEGSIKSRPNQLHIRIENKKYDLDSANLTITIQMRKLLTNEIMMGPYNTPCNWVTKRLVTGIWDFKLQDRIYKPSFIKLSITIKGFNDDLSLYKKTETKGLVIGSLILIKPIK